MIIPGARQLRASSYRERADLSGLEQTPILSRLQAKNAAICGVWLC
jgi:hypothetical protein